MAGQPSAALTSDHARLAIAGATVPQIATFTGHSLRDVEAIPDAHYLGRDEQLAEAAVLKLEARTKTVKRFAFCATIVRLSV